MRPRAIAGLLGMVCCLACTAWAEEYRRTVTHTVDLYPRGRVEIDTRIGDIRIAAWEKRQVRVEAEKVVRAGSEKSAQKRFKRIQVLVGSDDETVQIRSRHPPRRPWRPFRGGTKLGVDFTIRMPSQATLRVKGTNGDVTIEGLRGHQRIRLTYGSVEVTVPSRRHVRNLKASTLVGYVENNLNGQQGAGFLRKVQFWNPSGTQDIEIRVRMGGVLVHAGGQESSWKDPLH